MRMTCLGVVVASEGLLCVQPRDGRGCRLLHRLVLEHEADVLDWGAARCAPSKRAVFLEKQAVFLEKRDGHGASDTW